MVGEKKGRLEIKMDHHLGMRHPSYTTGKWLTSIGQVSFPGRAS